MKVEKVIFMIKKLYNDLFFTKEPYTISKDIDSKQLGEFYLQFKDDPQKLNKLITGFDDEGIDIPHTCQKWL